MGRLLLEAGGRRVDGGVLGRGVDRLAHAPDQVIDRGGRVVDLRRQVGVDRAAGHPAPGARDDRALARALDGLVDHAVDVHLDARTLGGEREVLAARSGELDRLVERRAQLVLDLLAGLVPGQATDVDPADLDAVGDVVTLAGVVEVDGSRPDQQDDEEAGHEDERLVSHGRKGVERFGSVGDNPGVSSRTARDTPGTPLTPYPSQGGYAPDSFRLRRERRGGGRWRTRGAPASRGPAGAGWAAGR